MINQGPPLELLLHRLNQCPPEFLLPPKTRSAHGVINLSAIVHDHMRAWSPTAFSTFRQSDLQGIIDQSSVNHLQMIAVTVWLLHDPWFLARPDLAPHGWRLLTGSLKTLADIVNVNTLLGDPDRREELARLSLSHLGLRPAGETVEQAKDRLGTLDSVERLKVMGQTRAALERARLIREQMAKEAAQAAATRYSSE
jgi:hypothetical protein